MTKASYNELRDDYTRHEEWPFSSETKWMAVKACMRNTPDKQLIFMKGGINEVIQQCSFYNGHNMQPQPLTTERIKNFMTNAENLMSSGQRVIAMAKGSSFGELRFCGIVGIMDPPRDGVHESIEALRRSGVEVKVAYVFFEAYITLSRILFIGVEKNFLSIFLFMIRSLFFS
jgi:Ca2+-transporting ATPase